MDLHGVAFLGNLGSLVLLVGLGKLWLTNPLAPQQGLYCIDVEEGGGGGGGGGDLYSLLREIQNKAESWNFAYQFIV